MKKLVLLAILWMFHLGLHAQAPTKMSYQAVLRNPSGELVGNKQIRVKVSILEKSETGNVVFAELQQIATNVNGLFSLIVGDGKAESGDIAKIDWSKGLYYIKTEIDPDGGTNYSLVNTSQLLSVPYALYATNTKPGPKGDKGETGDKGADGKDGAQGPKGDKGDIGDKGLDGKDGAQGPKGDKGDPGDKGADGKDGAQGPKGDKGDPGDKGADGKDGAQGIKGDKGDIGDKGADGKDGAQGPKGDKGDIGDKGLDGKDGAQGPKGDKGDIGDKGADGKDGAQGLKGDKGDIGDKGADGKDGAQGPKGDKGDTGDKGADGKDGAQGPKGDKGDIGDKGADGKDGAQGPKGDKGDTGDKGANGKDGAQGPKGDKGDTGEKGLDGQTGAQGPKGDKGEPGDKGADGKDGLQGPKGDKGDAGAGFQAGSIKNQLLYWNGTAWVILNPGSNGERLTICDDELTWAVGGICPGKIEALNCGTATNIGTLIADTPANGVSSILAYTGGNSGGYSTQTIASTGVTGLTATLTAGILANGNGSLTFEISGTPSASGTASFEVNVGGKSCVIILNVNEKITNELLKNQVQDIDGNNYKTVIIGNKLWMTENLRVSKYKDGEIIENTNILAPTVWPNLQSGAYCHYNYDNSNDLLFGKLYNWYAVNTEKLCPNGWRMPRNIDWEELIDNVGGIDVAGGLLKISGKEYWQTNTTISENKFLFSATGSGWNVGDFRDQLIKGFYWSSQAADMGNGYGFSIFDNQNKIEKEIVGKTIGGAVRCIRDTIAPILIQGSIEGIDCNKVINKGVLIANVPASKVSAELPYTGGNNGSYSGQSITSTGVIGLTATLSTGTFENGNGTLIYEISGTPSTNGTAIFAVNIGGANCNLQINVISKLEKGIEGNSLKDIDGNSYKTVIIGSQLWMSENLKVSKYNTGEKIENTNLLPQNVWPNLQSGAFCNYNYDSGNDLLYGKLYNWYAVNTQELCPKGWRMPRNNDWEALSDYVGGKELAGEILKISGKDYWQTNTVISQNKFKFSATGSGWNVGDFRDQLTKGFYWSAQGADIYNAYGFSIIDNQNKAEVEMAGKMIGGAVRCMKDTIPPIPIQGSIQTIDCGTATNNGTLTANTPANGVSSVIAYTGGNGGTHSGQTISSTGVTGLTATLAAGKFKNGDSTVTYEISGTPSAFGIASFDLNIGGKTCTFTRTIDKLLTSEINFTSIGTPIGVFQENISDIDGNTYKTVKIGDQIWMGENLKVSKYNDGTDIPKITDNGQWQYTTSNAWTYINNDSTNNIKYGKLYNWYAVSTTTNGNKNLCPTGWHVPTDAEWTILTEYLGGSSVAGGKMKEIGSTSWNSPNSEASNSSLFSALPGGSRYYTGSFNDFGGACNWWSATEYNTYSIWAHGIVSGSGVVVRSYPGRDYGLSVRCIKDNTPPLPIQGSIQGIDCGTATNNGTLTANTSANGVSSVIAYTGGNGGTHLGQTISSTGVTGLTATLAAGTFKNGDSTVTYEISGIPSASGTASFDLNIRGKTCTLTRNVETVQVSGINFTSIGKPIANFLVNVSDIEGNSYKTVQIGNQVWMAENLKVSKYNDGSIIPKITDNTQWSKSTSGAWCYYNNDSVNNTKYGKIYNWYALNKSSNGNKNVCPKGWHVPTDAEWNVLTDYLGGTSVAGNKLKEIGTTNWSKTNQNVTNESLFTGLPGGYRSSDYGYFYGIKTDGWWWSSSGENSNSALPLVLDIEYGLKPGKYRNKSEGMSVRCINDDTLKLTYEGTVNSLDCGSANNQDVFTANLPVSGLTKIITYTDGNGRNYEAQIIPSKGSTGLTARLSGGSFANGNGSLNFLIEGTPTSGTASFEVNMGGKSCTASIVVRIDTIINHESNVTPIGINSEDVIDIDGNTYKSVIIGTQQWMSENLRVSKYNDGTRIPNVKENSEWSKLTSGGWAYYNNDSLIKNVYGKLYNWYSVSASNNSNKNVCPIGWHVPSDAEWTILVNYLGGESIAGGKLKEIGTAHWNNPNTDATNSALFSAVPGGYRFKDGNDGTISYNGIWWSSSEFNTDNAWIFGLNYSDGLTRRYNNFKGIGFSVRCLKDEPTPLPIQGAIQSIDCGAATNNGTLTANTPANGVSSVIAYTGGNGASHQGQTISSTGVTGLTATLAAGKFAKGDSTLTYEISGTPSADGTASFEINIGGKTCTLTRNVIVPTSGYGENITDVDGNSYKTVYIGTQQWMGENLKVSKYNDGTEIPNITDNTQWSQLTTGAWVYYNNDIANNTKYGKLYNWYAVSATTNGNKNVCPSGWHVPTDTEWTVLSDYLGGQSVAGGKMKEEGTINWSDPNTDATNSSLFSGLPGGYFSSDLYFQGMNLNGDWWSASLDNSDVNYALNRYITYNENQIVRNGSFKISGLSIRCLKGEPTTPPQPIQGSIQTIDCGTATNNGTLTVNTSTSGVSSVIAYTGGNGGSHSGQTISSTGVTGLTATLTAGTFANGDSTVTYEISGTPSADGTASFEVNIGGKTCTLTRQIVIPIVGSEVNGGIVAYVFNPGDKGYVAGEVHGIIVAKNDLAQKYIWAWGVSADTMRKYLSGLSEKIGFGKENTTLILEIAKKMNTNFNAVNAAKNYTDGVYTDWFLPTLDELKVIKTNLSQKNIGGFITNENNNGVLSTSYWASNLMDNYVGAIAYAFSQQNNDICGCAYFEQYSVRPVRYF